ncbi:MAG: helix-turn-helix domain-containing protein [Desulfococcaceae bacterium]|nr:helix-turn-helix domain-containing protein [Desulfococcaceae bacterium]
MNDNFENKNQEHPYNLQKAVERFERGYLANVLQLCQGDKKMTAELLGIRNRTLEQKIRKYGIMI